MKYVLRLYVAGQTAHGRRAKNNLEKIADQFLEGLCDIEVIDILETPKLAFEESILVTPTLVRSSPPPTRKVIGDLSNSGNVLLGLGLNPVNDRKSTEQGEEV